MSAPVVASVPGHTHVYVRHLSPVDGDGPRRLPDPTPHGGATSPQQWWPPVMLDAAWVDQADFDVFHLHFGFDAWAPAVLQDVADAVHRRGRPFVFTVHDLRNPHHRDRTLHDQQLDVLVPAADALITLTDGAADEIERRWGRRPTVVPHPHVVDLPTMERLRRPEPDASRVFRVGLHAKSLRASMDPAGLLPTLVETVADLPDAVLQINIHKDVMEGGDRHDAALASALRQHAAAEDLELHVHDFLPDDELWRYLAALDVSVLPYRFGTHSGWLEACRDLGTTVVAPSCGYYADQGPVLGYVHDEDHLDAATLAEAVRTAYVERPRWGVDADFRRRQRAEVAHAHAVVYAEAAQ